MRRIFYIDSSLNVFNDWGVLVGRVVGPGVVLENTIIGIITMVVATIFFGIAYMLARLTIEGVKYIFKGMWLMAVICLLPAGLITGTMLFGGAVASGSLIPYMNQQRQQEQELRQIQDDIGIADQASGTLVVPTSFGDVTFEKLPGLYTAEDIRGCQGVAYNECATYFLTHRGFWAYRVTIPPDSSTLNQTNVIYMPDRFFGAKVNNPDEKAFSPCFYEAFDAAFGVFSWEVNQWTNPAMLYCEADATTNPTFEIDLYGPPGSYPGYYPFKIVLDPRTGLLSLTK